MSSSSFHVVYDGPALTGSTIDVRDLAPALLAFGEVIEQANLTLNEGRTQIALRVHASFKSGCFGIDFSVVQSLLSQVSSLFKESPVSTAKDLTETLGFAFSAGSSATTGVIFLIRWLRNRKVRRVVLLDNGKARVELDDEHLETELRTINLLRNFKLRQALEAAVVKPLSQPGIDSVAISTSPDTGFVTITKTECRYFVAPVLEHEEIQDKTTEASLQLVSVSFKGDNKWRLSDGSSHFHAAILDDRFLHRVHTGESSFSAGDILTVRLRKRQWLESDTLKAEYEVLEVLDHRRGMSQIPMLLSGGSDPPI